MPLPQGIPWEAESVIEMKAQLAGNAALAQIEAVQKEWLKAMQEEVADIQKEYEKTVATWSHRVTFETKVQLTNTGITGEVKSAGPNSKIYWFVHESVSVMRGVLSSDWSPKTQPGVLGSGAGSGRLLYASKKVSKPPYEARKFTDAIIKVRQKPFEKRMQHATAVGARAASRGG